MTRRWAKLAAAAVCVAVAVGVAVFRNTQPAGADPRPDLRPSAHWVFDADGVTGNKVADRCGRLPGALIGSPKLLTTAPTPRLEFAGPDDGVVIRDRVTPDADFLPKEAFTVVAWVRIDEPTEWGGILGCFQDNGPAEYGFILGFNKTAFYLGLSTKGADDGDGKLTYLAGKTAYQT